MKTDDPLASEWAGAPIWSTIGFMKERGDCDYDAKTGKLRLHAIGWTDHGSHLIGSFRWISPYRIERRWLSRKGYVLKTPSGKRTYNTIDDAVRGALAELNNEWH